MRGSQEQEDAGQYVNDLVEKASKVESEFQEEMQDEQEEEEEEYGEEEEV